MNQNELITKLPNGLDLFNFNHMHYNDYVQKVEVEDNNNLNIPNKKKYKDKALIEAFLMKIDELYELYDDNTKSKIRGKVRDEIVNLLAQDFSRKYFGPKAISIITKWLTGEIINVKEMSIYICEFIAFMLNITVYVLPRSMENYEEYINTEINDILIIYQSSKDSKWLAKIEKK